MCRQFRSRIVERQSLERRSHIVLTRKRSEDSLADLLTELKRNFRQLRQRTIWTNNVIGSAFIIHLVSETKPDQWHPHLHVLASLVDKGERGLNTKTLRAHWNELTGGSPQVHVTRLNAKADERWRISNYMIRPAIEHFRSDAQMMNEFKTATVNRPLMGMLGAWRYRWLEGDSTIDDADES